MCSSKVLLVIVLLSTGSVVIGQICQSQHTVSGLKKDVVVYESVRYGHYIDLQCCSSNRYTDITWMKFNKDTNQWQKYIPDRDDVILLESNQVLSIQSAVFEDTGSYKCQVQNDTAVVAVKEFKLTVIACDKLARGAFPVSPLPCTETVASEKETITLPCTGYFGCGDEGDIRIAMWYVSIDTVDNWKEISEVDVRYTETKFEEDSGSIVGSNLTIKDVSSVDFNRKFMCLLATPQVVKGQTSIVVTLKHSHKTDQDSVLLSGFDSGEVIISLTVVVLVLLITTVVLIVLFIHTKLSKTSVRRGGEDQWMTKTYIKDSQKMLP